MMGSIMALSSQSTAGNGVGAHQSKKQKSESEVDKIGHGATPPNLLGVLAPVTNKVSIQNSPSRHKENAKMSAFEAAECARDRELQSFMTSLCIPSPKRIAPLQSPDVIDLRWSTAVGVRPV
jgi:hypothetical protein